MKPYCIQNNGDCSTCSLVNYNRDCYNVPIWGGARPGSGRKPVAEKRKPYAFRLTQAEHAKVKAFIAKMKEEKKVKMKYRGVVIDELGTMETRRTKWYGTYKEAHDAAEKLCKRTMGNRGRIDVEEVAE